MSDNKLGSYKMASYLYKKGLEKIGTWEICHIHLVRENVFMDIRKQFRTALV